MSGGVRCRDRPLGGLTNTKMRGKLPYWPARCPPAPASDHLSAGPPSADRESAEFSLTPVSSARLVAPSRRYDKSARANGQDSVPRPRVAEYHSRNRAML